ncbi:MAG: hypothetical protein KY445_02855, partial [Armatimonadetes bacterium]|nr:hypothetical protein [Armatimonadota bacterium]
MQTRNPLHLTIMPKLLLVDGYSLLYRAFFSSPPFSTQAGEPTGALYGFIRMVTRLLDENQPDYAVVAIDAPGGTFRHDADETYKANRSVTPDDLKIQQKLVRELLDGLSIPRYEHVGFEADDVIGTLASRGASRGEEVIIVTGDGDYLQLVEDKVRVLLTRKGVSDLETYDEAAVQARYGFAPKLVADFKGLKGDASDNIPGVPGIGDKTAMSLIQKFGPLEGIYEHLEEVMPPRIRELLRTHQEQARHSRHMATIVCDLPVEKEPEEFQYDPRDPQKRALAAQTARRFEFKSLAARYEAPPEAGQDAPRPEVAPAKIFEVTLETTDSPRAALDWLEKRGSKALVAISQGEDGFYLAHEAQALLFTGDLTENVAAAQTSFDFGENHGNSLGGWLEDDSKPKIAHDAKALMRRLQAQNIKLDGLAADTLVMGYLCEPARQQHSIPFLAEKFLRYSLPAAPAPKKRSKNASLFEGEGPNDEEIAARRQFAAAHTAVLGELEPVLRHALREIGHEKIFEEMELPLIKVLAQIESVGNLIAPHG